MKKGLLSGLLIILIIGSFLAASCGSSSTTPSTSAISPPSGTTQMTVPPPVQPSVTTTTSPPTSTATTANWWDKFGTPQYGGTLNVRAGGMDTQGNFDPNLQNGGGPWLEQMTFIDWKVDPKVWPFLTQWIPTQYSEGLLAESWEQTDPTTLTVNLRQGVHWQNKAPVNGRELTAADVQFSYDRVLGTGSGYTQLDPFYFQQASLLARVVATGKYTLQFKFNSTINPLSISNGMGNSVFEVQIIPPEWAALGGPPVNSPPSGSGGPPGPGAAPTAGGPLSDWQNAVGTGPWILTGFQQGSSLTLSKNPDYWGHDERHPQNQLPYADMVKDLQITDNSTAIAAMRTGKLDMAVNPLFTLTDGITLQKSDPGIQISWYHNPGAAVLLRCDKKPFTDIKVREALQLAIDVASIGKNYYKGHSNDDPVGLVSPYLTGWTTPYDQWPAAVQQQYAYNPDKAKQLLTEAGYPNGFNTDIVTASDQDLQLLQIFQSYFKDIGVNMTINTMDGPTSMAFISAGKQDQMVYFDTFAGMSMSPLNSLASRYSKEIPMLNWTFNNDSNYDALYEKLLTTTTVDEAQQIVKQADMYAIQQHWTINGPVYDKPLAWQPWVMGYSGQSALGGVYGAGFYARVWIDNSLRQ